MIKKIISCIILFTLFIALYLPLRSSAAGTEELPLSTRLDGEIISVAFNYKNNTDMRIIFSKCGINSIMAISSISSSKGNSRLEETATGINCSVLYRSHTDWLSPYIVKANSKGYNNPPAFTGGWHEVSSSQGPCPTACTDKFSIYADGKAVPPCKTISCRKADIYVCNLVQAYNTTSRKSNKEVLKETVHYSVTGCKISVSVVMEALEGITVSRYYGLQSPDTIWNGKIYYKNGKNASYGTSVEKYSTSGAKKTFPEVNGYMVYSKDKSFGLEVQIDRKYGLGTMSYVSGNLPCAFTVGYGKSYLNLINGCSKTLAKGQKLCFRGCYIFK